MSAQGDGMPVIEREPWNKGGIIFIEADSEEEAEKALAAIRKTVARQSATITIQIDDDGPAHA